MLHKKRPSGRIEEIIGLVKQQVPKRTDVIKSLKKCSEGTWTSSGYFQFSLSKKGKSADWKFHENLLLEHEFLGFIVLDILKNGRIAGIEFINLIEE